MKLRSIICLLVLMPACFWTALYSNHAFGVGGTIAISMGEANQVDRVNVPFKASAKLSSEGHTITETINFSPSNDGMLNEVLTVEGQSIRYIRRIGSGITWMLLPNNMYIESVIGDPLDRAEDYTLISREVLGTETVNGEATTKYKVLYKSDKGTYGGLTWFTDDNIAIKADLVSAEDGKETSVSFEMYDLERGPQPPELFELPAGANKMGIPGLGGRKGLPGGSPAQSGMQDTPLDDTLKPPLIRQMQLDLAALGYDPGPADGQLGARTQLAIGQFETDQGLPYTGQPSFEVAFKIRSVAAGISDNSTAVTGPADADEAALIAAQQDCFQRAAQANRKKRRWKSLASTGARLARRLGGTQGAQVGREVYNTAATTNDAATIARDLGITEDAVQRCIDESAGR